MTDLIHDNSTASRFEMTVENSVAFIDYRRSPGKIALLHAEVPTQLEGQGVGSRLVKAVLEAIRASGDKVDPRCSFVAAFIQRHPEYQDLSVQ